MAVPSRCDTPPPRPVLLVSAVFPPHVGGSAVLFENIYRRSPGAVGVLTTAEWAGAVPHDSIVRIAKMPSLAREWGISSCVSAARHIRLAGAIRREAAKVGNNTRVHCGRALPEGVAAWIARVAGGPPYACWVHGEDLAAARTSRELSWLSRLVLGGAETVYANSENSRRMALEFGAEAERVAVVYPGVDCQRFRPDVNGEAVRRRHGVGANDLVVLTVGRLQRRKGQDIAILATSALASRRPGLRHLVVGNGEDYEYLGQLIQGLEQSDHVTLVGEVDDSELAEYYAAADVFLLPNREERGDIEGFGIVFLEAAASGKPAIGGRSGGVSEAIEDGVTGILVDAEQVDLVIAALESLTASPALRQSLGQGGRRRAESFSWDRAAAIVFNRV